MRSDLLTNTANLGGGLAHGEFGNLAGAVTTTARISASRVEGNSALQGGGLVNWPYGVMEIEQSQVVSNTATQVGGVFNTNHLTLDASTVAYNQAQAAGGLANLGQMTVTGSLVTYNHAFSLSGGIFNQGALFDGPTPPSLIEDSTIVGNSGDSGGGILQNSNSAPLIISGTRIAGNTATTGGGVAVSGTLTMTNSLVLTNTATQSGGGLSLSGATTVINNTAFAGNVAVTGDGGGLHANESGLAMTNTTVSGNTAGGNGGGLYQNAAVSNQAADLNNVTLAHNTVLTGDGGGLYIYSTAPITLTNTLLAGNSDGGGEAPDCAGTLTTGGYNLFEDTTGCTLTGTAPGDVVNLPAFLAPLADNGGDTLTHALLYGSPALAAGNPATPGSGGGACEANDQRGVTRPQGARCDIGAFESDLAPPLTILFSAPTYTATEDVGSAPFTLTLSTPAAFTVTVSAATTLSGTASPAGDYAPLSATITFTPGVQVVALSLPISDDALYEGNETVVLALGNPVSATLGNPLTATLTIHEDDTLVHTLYFPLILRAPNPAGALRSPAGLPHAAWRRPLLQMD